uniref:LD27042p (inferred by orthology to a D. melanogaster protein) n=1 Tax=Nippostrongylus brasiliensis TaxID=27835 RepID=A0A0N4XGD0_NIPBR
LSRVTENELIRKVDEEEREWAERAEDVLSTLSTVTEGDKKAAITPEEMELKRKTGKVAYRSIVYNEGELDESDLSSPPSPSNPHPFVPSKHAPPVYSRSIVPFINYSPLLQAFVDIGVNLFEVEQTTRAAKHLLRLDMEKELQWLVSLGFDVNDLGEYLTRNPFFLLQDLNDLETSVRLSRISGNSFNKFVRREIAIGFSRYWLNVDVKTMDSRLGWIQEQFRLSGDDVRDLIRKDARVVMFGLGPLQRLVTLFNKEFEFTPKQMKKMLLSDPRLFIMDPKFIIANYGYIHRTMRLSNAIIAEHPFILRCSHSSIRNRHEFLKKVGRAVYEGAIVDENAEASMKNNDETIEVNVSMCISHVFLDPSDEVFVRKAANSYLVIYNNFLRSH